MEIDGREREHAVRVLVTETRQNLFFREREHFKIGRGPLES